MKRLTNKRFVYALFDPIDKSPRYVGVSNNPHARFGQHIFLALREGRDSKREKITRSTLLKTNWICDLHDIGLLPDLVVLTEPIENYNEMEAVWHEYYKSLGYTLFNANNRIGINNTNQK